MKNHILHSLLVFRWPWWTQNVLFLAAGIPVAKLLGEITSQNPILLLQAAILILVLIPAFILASSHSTYLLPYVFLIWMIGPEIRRLADWVLNEHGTLNLLSLTPLLTTSMILFSIIKKRIVIPKPMYKVLVAYSIPFIYAAVIGLLMNKIAGMYSIANYFIPLLILIYLTINPASDQEKQTWLQFYVTLAVLLSIYAWFQYLYLPPWDRFWMEGANMVSLGIPEPMQFRAFSTLNATGPLAVFLVSALIPAIVNPKWRGIFGVLGIVLMISALAITLVRASWVTLAVGIIIYFLFSSNVSRWKMVGTVATLVVTVILIIPIVPGSQEVSNRLDTFSNLNEDHSTNVRLLIFVNSIPEIIKNPVGAGMGSIGLSTSLNGGQSAAGLSSVDNGYIGVFLVFGLFGGIMFFRAIVLHWREISKEIQSNSFRVLGLTSIIFLLVSFMFGGELTSINAVIYWLFAGLVIQKEIPDHLKDGGH